MIRNEDTKLTKLFVGGLPYDTNDHSLREFFEQFGEIREAVVIRERETSKSKGYGFVSNIAVTLSFPLSNLIDSFLLTF